MSNPTTGEWTAGFVSQLYCTLSPWQNIADSHNAALAAERDKCKTHIFNGQLLYDSDSTIVNIDYDREIQQLRDQLVEVKATWRELSVALAGTKFPKPWQDHSPLANHDAALAKIGGK